jgi:hypothetical protein
VLAMSLLLFVLGLLPLLQDLARGLHPFRHLRKILFESEWRVILQAKAQELFSKTPKLLQNVQFGSMLHVPAEEEEKNCAASRMHHGYGQLPGYSIKPGGIQTQRSSDSPWHQSRWGHCVRARCRCRLLLSYRLRWAGTVHLAMSWWHRTGSQPAQECMRNALVGDSDRGTEGGREGGWLFLNNEIKVHHNSSVSLTHTYRDTEGVHVYCAKT